MIDGAPSKEMRELCEQAVEQQRNPDPDPETWALRLTQQVINADD